MTGPMIWVFFILLAFAVPIGHAMLGGVAAALWLDGKPLAVIAQRLYSPTQSFPMLAIPFFILAGNLMMSGKFEHPAMHTTHTLDAIILIKGRVKLILDNEEAEIGPGDVVVQRATNHAWAVVGDEPALFVAVLVDRT